MCARWMLVSAVEGFCADWPRSDLGTLSMPRARDVGRRAIDLDCRLFPFLASKIQTSRLASCLLLLHIDFSFPPFVLFVASLAPHNYIISTEVYRMRWSVCALQRLGPPSCPRPGLLLLAMTLLHSCH